MTIERPMPVDRRQILTGGAALATVVATPQMPAQAATPDPIFAAIEICKELKAQCDARYARVSCLYGEARKAGLRDESELVERNAFVEERLGCHPDSYTDQTADAWWEAIRDLFGIEPTTLPGILALLRFAELVAEDDNDLVEENSTVLVATLAASMETITNRGLA
jgi:hypothetical protein